MKITINWFVIAVLPYTVYVGITEKVSWWVILLVYLLTVNITSTFKIGK